MFLGSFFFYLIFLLNILSVLLGIWSLFYLLFVFFLIITKCLLNYPSGDRDWYCSALALFSSKTSLHSCNAKKIIAFIQGGPSTLSRSREEFLHSSKTNTTVYSVHHFLCSSDIKSDQNIVYVFIFKNILVPYINLKKKPILTWYWTMIYFPCCFQFTLLHRVVMCHLSQFFQAF